MRRESSLTEPSGTDALRRALESVVSPSRVLTRLIERVAYASDASVYRPIPQAVVLAADVAEVRALFAVARRRRIPLTFRAAGTSLSGQAVTSGLLVEVKRHWRQIEVLDQGRRIRLGPGVLGGDANAVLKPFGAKIGPDPSSLTACAVGGILANNASGKCCGVVHNAYHTLESIAFVLPSGTCVDTADPDADERFREAEPALAQGLMALKAELETDAGVASRIRAKYRLKNTTGYGLNAFLDFSRPVDIFSHLLIGSEGTLAFIASAVLRTIPDLPAKLTGLLLFASVHDACEAITPLRAAGAKALELMDGAAIRAVAAQPGVPADIALVPSRGAALLVEFQAEDDERLNVYRTGAAGVLAQLPLLQPAAFSDQPAQIARLWRVRDGLYPSVGAVRRLGTSVIIEDVAFPLERLADAVVDLEDLFAQHGYDEAIVFGHAGDGNLHFVITQSFNDAAAIERYARFMDDLAALVVRKYDGALKAEHGTGRNMAPFVEAEWGTQALSVMRRLKALADPEGVLNPGVILSDDPRGHLVDLKSLPAVDPRVDTCVECGFCERVCPSRELTLTPRQRIVVRREIARCESSAQEQMLSELSRDYEYAGTDTCAVDGLCATACPVGINTGTLIKHLRHVRHSQRAQRAAAVVARRFSAAERLARVGLGMAHAAQRLLGARAVVGITAMARSCVGSAAPLWHPDTPRPAGRLPRTQRAGAAAVYLPACVTRVFGRSSPGQGELALPDALVTVAARAGRPLWIPPDVSGTCCGTAFSSKGFTEGTRVAVNLAVERCWEWSEAGRLPVVVDANSCTLGLRECAHWLTEANRAKHARLRILDAVEFASHELLPRLQITARARVVGVHPTCSLTHLGGVDDLLDLARACANGVVAPQETQCCGFAGDRGFLVPELTASATHDEAALIRGAGCDDHISSNRMCEVALTRATGHAYRSVIQLLEESSRPRA